jgi:hypothetical protein
MTSINCSNVGFLAGQSCWKWPISWQWWHLMSDVRLVGTMDDEGFPTATPYEIEVLPGSVARGATVEGVIDMEGAFLLLPIHYRKQGR